METFKINMNEELSGVELTFSQKPDTRILTTLKDAGFRWHRVKKLWYAKRSETTLQVIAELKEGPSGTVIDNEPKPTDAGSEKENLDGVKIGDLYVASWGYEQTNLSFFQVVKISAHNAWFIEVAPEVKEESDATWGSRTISFKTDGGMLTPIRNATFIKDQLRGDRKSTKHGTIKFAGYAYAHKYNGSGLYESWYA
ncbi:hypothetical protein DWX17_23655 [[Clostridium] innocuum]|uniref:hypothetical protein n=1 Tax=Clostridium innocuum TaxID=1522 RepID=UPI000E4DB28D|nr:hypothetical protein [[Clostridium] innocuum]RGT59568.1 hypothetical protein DWX17_23655 [[Clostridium] innocuum]